MVEVEPLEDSFVAKVTGHQAGAAFDCMCLRDGLCGFNRFSVIVCMDTPHKAFDLFVGLAPDLLCVQKDITTMMGDVVSKTKYVHGKKQLVHVLLINSQIKKWVIC